MVSGVFSFVAEVASTGTSRTTDTHSMNLFSALPVTLATANVASKLVGGTVQSVTAAAEGFSEVLQKTSAASNPDGQAAENIEQSIADLANALNRRLQDLMASAGLSLPSDFRLELSSLGNVYAEGPKLDQGNQAAIESILNADAELRSIFQQWSDQTGSREFQFSQSGAAGGIA